MSLVQLSGPERPSSSRSTIILSSNNPFRNRQASPQEPTFNIPPTPPARPVSRNPFFERTESRDAGDTQPRSLLPDQEMSWNSGNMAAPRPGFTDHTVELFNNLKLNALHPENRTQNPLPPPGMDSRARTENVPPPSRGRTIPTHRPSRSHEQGNEQMPYGKHPRGHQVLDIFADPPATEKYRRPRRNSESSVADKSGRLVDPDDERRRKERRYREKDAKSRGEVRRPQTARPKKPSQRLDLIDQLDVTSIYGTGLFHHDGPFDACNPHRNRKGSQRAPMQAFPKDSANNLIGGSGPVHKDIDFAQFHGRGAEGFTDYSTSGVAARSAEPVVYESYAGASAPIRAGPGIRPGIDRTSSFNPTARVEPVHGDESMGLGTSTFLEGAPASRTAIKRRESETDHAGGGFGGTGGLGRKKSLVQKIRGMSNTNRGAGTVIRVTSPERSFERTTSPTMANEHPLSAGGVRKMSNTNPFFNDLDDPQENKSSMIQIAEERNRVDGAGAGTRERAISSPKRQVMGGLLERRITNDGTGAGNGESKSGGFLSRVKSLKGGRRAKPENRE